MSITAESRLPLEPAGRDFPYYREEAATISPGGWVLIILAVAAGFAALTVPLGFTDTLLTGWLRAVAFVGLPLAALRIAAGSRWTAIFGRIGLREIKLMVVFALLNIVISFAVGGVVKGLGFTAADNAAIAAAGDLEGARLASFFAKVGLQLLGEELLTILPFLALLAFIHHRLGAGRNAAVIAAWLLSAVIFGALHLPTYDWNVVQSIVIIGSARLVLTWAYIWSKNIWVSTGAHIINDWALISLTMFAAPMAAAAAG